MKLATLIKRLQKIAAKCGGDLHVRTRDRSGYYEPLTRILSNDDTVWIDTAE